MMLLAAKRYAEALADISLESNQTEDYRQQLKAISDIYTRENELRAFLNDNSINPSVKKEFIKKVFAEKLKTEILNFLMLLIDKRRIDLLPEICSEYMLITNRKRNILNMTIISAEPLTESQINDIKEKYMEKHKASSFDVTNRIDKSIIGGVIVRIGDIIYDGSVKGRLEKLKNAIVS